MTLRSRLKEALRRFFGALDYLEIDTPVLVPCPGTEVHLGYFKTAWQDYQSASHPLWLRSSPELHMKQAMTLGLPRVFQMAPCFRNGGELAAWHHPEFTMLEWYQSGISYHGFIDQTEALLHDTLAQLAPTIRAFGGEPVRLPQRMLRITVAEAFARWAGVALIDEDPELGAKADRAGVVSVRADDDFETAFYKILIEKIEPALASEGAAVLMDSPPSQAALATVAGGVAHRFEVYIGRVELSNGFEELLDLATNQARIRSAMQRRRAMGSDVPDEDQGFYDALAKGLPPCCGNALGFDRWLAVLCGEPGIGTLIPFRETGHFGRFLPGLDTNLD